MGSENRTSPGLGKTPKESSFALAPLARVPSVNLHSYSTDKPDKCSMGSPASRGLRWLYRVLFVLVVSTMQVHDTISVASRLGYVKPFLQHYR